MLNIFSLFRAMPGSVAQGLIWGIMALGVYLTYKILNFADLTVDGSLATGGAVAVMLILNGCPPAAALAVSFAAGVLAGLIFTYGTWYFRHSCRYPDTDCPLFDQLKYHG